MPRDENKTAHNIQEFVLIEDSIIEERQDSELKYVKGLDKNNELKVVNIYPKETEDALIMHPKVADVAVFGVPHPEMGEEVKAVVQPIEFSEAGEELEQELMAFCKEKISVYSFKSF